MNQGFCENSAWAQTIVSTLAQAGIKNFFLSPGARSAPFIKALSSTPQISVVAHYDERGTAFAALGTAHATGIPSVCITTSGSAVANLFPAAVEAYHAQIPLIFLTADRPPELHGKGANQTIRQSGIFGDFALWQASLPCPDNSLLPFLPLWIHDAFLSSIGSQTHRPGPIHINAPFREPLLPPNKNTFSPPLFSLPPLSPNPLPHPLIPPASLSAWNRAKHGLLLVGELPPSSQKLLSAILSLASHLRWPIFADPLSGLKGQSPSVIDHADFLLLHPHAPHPDFVLHLGGKITSKRIGSFLRNLSSHNYLQARQHPEKLDPWDQNPTALLCDLLGFCQTSIPLTHPPTSPSWLPSWLSANQIAQSLLTPTLASSSPLSSLHLGQALTLASSSLSQKFPTSPSAIFLGNSSAIRDFDAYSSFSLSSSRPLFLGQRGTSGIDGNLAHIAGIAHAGFSVAAWIGDLTALHDIPSFALLADKPVILFILNNHGGGIFDFLPMDLPPASKEAWMSTPHSFSFASICAQFNLPHAFPKTLEEIESTIASAAPGPLCLEITESRTCKQSLLRSLASSLSQLPASSIWQASPCETPLCNP